MPIYATRIRSTNVSKAIFLNTSVPVEQTPRKEGKSITDIADTGDCPECLCPCCINFIAKRKDPLQTLQTQAIFQNSCVPVV